MALFLNMCGLYKKDGKSGSHLFLHCEFSRKMWIAFTSGLWFMHG